MIKPLLSYLSFLGTSMLLNLAPVMWEIFASGRVMSDWGLGESDATALVFYSIFALTASLGFGTFLVARAILTPAALPKKAMLLSSMASIPSFILVRPSIGSLFAGWLYDLKIMVPASLALLPVLALVSGLSGAAAFRLGRT